MKAMRSEDLYDQDFFAWTHLQAKELRRFARALRSWTARILEHLLLLLEHLPAEEPRCGWIDEIVTFRSEIERRLTPMLERDLSDAWLCLTTRPGAICNGSLSGTARGDRGAVA
jgi:hypothetical protein